MRRVCALILRASLFGLVAACGDPGPLTDLQPGETGRVVRVIDGDALALNTGQSVRLVGIEAPALRPRGRDPDPYAVEASRLLEDLVLGRQVRLYYPGLTRDRYDRALAHVVTVDGSGPRLWINLELVRRGGARVRLYPDTAAHADDLLAAEDEARGEARGLWARSFYRIVQAQDLDVDWRGFTLVEAELGPLITSPDRTDEMACQRSLLNADLILDVSKDAAAACDLGIGTQGTLRGWASRGHLKLEVEAHLQLRPNAD